MTMTAERAVMGSQTPRLAHIPDSYDNAYREAVDLAAAYGLYLDEWQSLTLKGWLGELQNGRWTCPRCGLSVPRQNGKGGALEARELYGLVVLNERILHTAHEVKTAKDHFRRMLNLFEHPELKPLVKNISRTNGEEAIWLRNGGVIRFIARSRNSGRGFSADLLVCDEAQDLDDDKFAALLPTISTSDNSQTILVGTPPDAHMNGEVFTRFRDAGLEGKDLRLCWLEWSADRDADLSDIKTWAQANPALGIRLGIDKTNDEFASMDEETFARERLGMWAGIASLTAVDMELWDTLKSDVDPSNPVAFAIDVSPDRDYASIGVAGYVGNAVHVQVIEHRKGTGWVVSRLKELRDKWSPVAIVVDQGSPAASLIPDLQRERIRFTQTNATDMALACGAFYDRTQQSTILHANQPVLNTALAAASKRPVRDAWAWKRKNSNADITPLVAVTLAAHGLTTTRKPRGHSSEQPRKVMLL